MQMPGEITPPTIGSYRTLSCDSDAYTDVVIWVERLTIRAYSSVPFIKVVQSNIVVIGDCPTSVAANNFIELFAIAGHASLDRCGSRDTISSFRSCGLRGSFRRRRASVADVLTFADIEPARLRKYIR